MVGFTGNFGKDKKKKEQGIVSQGLSRHLNHARAQASEASTPENNCFLWYDNHRLYANGAYDLSTSKFTSTNTSAIPPSAPTAENASDPEKNPFGLLAKSLLLSANETFGPKDSYQRHPESEVGPNLFALNKQLMNAHLENPFSVEAIHQHALLASLSAAEETNEDVDCNRLHLII